MDATCGPSEPQSPSLPFSFGRWVPPPVSRLWLDAENNLCRTLDDEWNEETGEKLEFEERLTVAEDAAAWRLARRQGMDFEWAAEIILQITRDFRGPLDEQFDAMVDWAYARSEQVNWEGYIDSLERGTFDVPSVFEGSREQYRRRALRGAHEGISEARRNTYGAVVEASLGRQSISVSPIIWHRMSRPRARGRRPVRSRARARRSSSGRSGDPPDGEGGEDAEVVELFHRRPRRPAIYSYAALRLRTAERCRCER